MGQFDPYHKWLGIPPDEQPPNHYRLLGIQSFEVDLDVIDSAADQRMNHLRQFQTGRHAELSQRLLNEIAAARICLLSAANRAAYDEQLRRSLGPPPTVQEALPTPPSFPDLGQTPLPQITRQSASRRPRRKRLPPIGHILSITIAVALAAVAIVVWQFARDQASAIKTNAKPASSAMTPNGRPSNAPSSERQARGPSSPAPRPNENRKDDQKAPRTSHRKPVLVVDQSPAAQPVEPVLAEDAPIVAISTRRAAPSSGEYEAAVKQLRDLYRNDISDANTSESQQRLAGRLLREAARTAGGDATAQFALMCLARDFAVEGSDGVMAFRVIDLLAEKFEIEPVPQKADVLSELAKKAKTAAQHASVAEEAVVLIDAAADAGGFTLAERIGNLAVAESVKGRDKSLAARAKRGLRDSRDALRLLAESETAERTLADAPDDPEANAMLAVRYCFLVGDWEKGLPHLAKGNDPATKALAQRELEQPPSEAEGWVALADAWWDLAQESSGRRKRNTLLHAGDWYGKAKSALPDGLVRIKVEKRLAEVKNFVPNLRREAMPLLQIETDEGLH